MIVNRLLTPAEVVLCVKLGLEYGHDVDTTPHQFTHVCWPYAAYEGSLCASPHLWGHAGLIAEVRPLKIDCDECLSALEQLHNGGATTLLAIIGKLAHAVRTLSGIEAAVSQSSILPTAVLEAMEKDGERHSTYAAAYTVKRDLPR